MLNKTFKFKNRGFTLIEVVMAISILTIGVLAAFNVVQNITIYSRRTSSRLTATYLAQEGIELVRNQRDTNWLEDMYLPGAVAWNQGLTGCGGGCEFGTVNIPGFTRTIFIEFPAGNQMTVSVEVDWQERGTFHQVTAKTELYNWLIPPP